MMSIEMFPQPEKKNLVFFLAPAKSKINPTNTSSSSKSLIISSLHKQYRLFFYGENSWEPVRREERKMFKNEYIFFSEPKLYSCSFCQKPSDTAWDLVQHVQSSHGRFSFQSCQAIFTDYKVNIFYQLSLYSPQCKYSPRNHSRSLCYCMKVFKSALRERRKPTWPLPLSGLRVEP